MLRTESYLTICDFLWHTSFVSLNSQDIAFANRFLYCILLFSFFFFCFFAIFFGRFSSHGVHCALHCETVTSNFSYSQTQFDFIHIIFASEIYASFRNAHRKFESEYSMAERYASSFLLKRKSACNFVYFLNLCIVSPLTFAFFCDFIFLVMLFSSFLYRTKPDNTHARFYTNKNEMEEGNLFIFCSKKHKQNFWDFICDSRSSMSQQNEVSKRSFFFPEEHLDCRRCFFLFTVYTVFYMPSNRLGVLA